MTRVLTAIAAIPITLIITWYAPVWGFALFTAALAAVCFDELLAMASSRWGGRPFRGLVALGAGVTLSFLWPLPDTFFVLSMALLISMTVLAFASPLETCGPRIAVTTLGLLYCSTLPGVLILLAGVPHGRASIVTLYVVIWAGDAAAYYTGRAFGRHLLAPRLSPKKTIEGAIGGAVASVGGGVAIGHWLRVDAGPGMSGLAFICLIAAIVGQIGDLAESALKRSAGVKDSSSILPGHGGMLDRLDSLLFAAPVFFWFFRA